MRLQSLELNSFKSFAQKTILDFKNSIVCIVGPNGSGKSNVVEAFRFVLGEQSMKSMRGKLGMDLIFKGSKNLSKGSRARVQIYFDNSDRIFKLTNDEGENVNLDYETINIAREVYPDGVNKYILNGTDVRLKDINTLLSSVHIGSSGHHIISQGEADRILNASPRDLREMIEDALGLKIYQYKIRDSERKLERSEENMREVSMLRRENAPHLKFLQKQIERIEKAKEMAASLGELYREYFKKESVYLAEERGNLSTKKNKITSELRGIVSQIDREEKTADKENKKILELEQAEREINELHVEKNELGRKLGRVEGMLESKESKTRLSGKCPLCGNIIRDEEKNKHEEELKELKTLHSETLSRMQIIESEEKDRVLRAETLKKEINQELESMRDKERAKFALKVKQQELNSALEVLKIKEDNVARGEEALKNEIREGKVLVGEGAVFFENFHFEGRINRENQEELRKQIERIKIKLEDSGGSGGEDTLREFREVSERDAFLAKEITDLETSIESLQKLITELREKIDQEFKDGVKKINKEFQEFFALLFNGGNATLKIIEVRRKAKNVDLEDENMEIMDTEEENEEGVEINVSLPHKKVKELHALSGGERSLTSIALLFAISQVNPPPFLILDETDAALDEANSKKFGDMVERLSKHSQLIIVTHNRETMSRAGVLYGVTIGQDGASKLLSVKFDEVVAVAK